MVGELGSLSGAVFLERNGHQISQFVIFFWIHVRVNPVNEIGGVFYLSERSEYAIPESENVSIVAVRQWLGEVVMHLVHVGGDNHPGQRSIQ